MNDFIKSDFCNECGGDGYYWRHHENPLADSEKEQCEECERLHQLEIRADRLQDEAKGN